jgi:hypothetical protein
MSSGDPASRRRRLPRLALVGLLLVLPLVVQELGVRLLIATDRLPVAAGHTPEFEITWQNLARLGTAEVLILGDSVSQQGIEPAILSSLIQRELGREVGVFNAASPGGTMGVNWAMVEQLAREGRLPRVAIVGIYPGTLKNDLTYSHIFGLTAMGGLFSGCERMSGYGQVIDCSFASVSAAWRWRGRPDRIVSALGTPVPQRANSGGLRLREDGFREGRGRRLEQLQAQMDRADLRRRIFVFPDEVSDGYVRLIDALRAHGVAIVPVAVPDTPALAERMERLQTGRRRLFREALDVLESRSGLAFVDPVSFGSWWRDGEARNFNHLSASGAVKFTRQLWRMPEFREPLMAGLTTQPSG